MGAIGHSPELPTVNEKNPAAHEGRRGTRLLAWAVASAALVLWTVAFTSPSVNPWRLEQLALSEVCGCVPVGRADDPGLYFLFGWLGAAGMAIGTLALSVLALAAVPMRLLPAALVALAMALQVGDVYVFPAVAMVAGLPLLLERRWLPVAGITVAAELMRSGAGLPLLGGLMLLGPWRLWLPTLAAFVAAHQLGGHVFWHTLYIGLGWQPNPYGIAYLDESARAIAGAVAYNSAEYEAAVRDAFLRLLAADPVFVVRTFVAKAWTLVDWRLVLLVASAVVLRRPVIIPIALAGALPAVLADARWSYQTGYTAAVLIATGAAIWVLGDRDRQVDGPDGVPMGTVSGRGDAAVGGIERSPDMVGP